MLNLDLVGAEVLRDGRLDREPLSVRDGLIVDATQDRQVDLTGFRILPGIVDVHGDAFERHVAPRRGAMKDMADGLRAAEAEAAANGVTTAVLAQFVSWEGGLRGPDFAARVFVGLSDIRAHAITDLRAQMRFEIHMLEHYADIPRWLRDWGIDYIVFNDHLEHDRLDAGRKPTGLTGQALKAGRSPEAHFQFLLDLNSRRDEVAAALDAICAELIPTDVRVGSHDDPDAAKRAEWRARGVTISEFPETVAAAEAAKAAGDLVILGSPNVVRGGSHKGNASAVDLIAMGYCDALASDYHYPSLRRAALMVARAGLADLAGAWAMVSSGPARVLGLADRGVLAPGLRADLVILDAEDRIAATMAGGRFSYLAGDVAERFIAA